MAKTGVGYLITASCFGGISLALILTSYSTEHWVHSDLYDGFEGGSNAHHGLFTGSLRRANLETVQTYSLYLACLDSVCSWSCLDTSDERSDEISQLVNTGTAIFNCKPSSSLRSKLTAEKTIDSSEFMNYALWASTVSLLSVSLLFNFVGVTVNVYNVFANPISFFTSIDGIFLYYGVSSGFLLLTLIVWGCEYGIYTTNNIAILDTLVGTFKSEPELQWSYYILIAAGLLQIAALGPIHYRKHIINRRDADQVIKADDSNNDANTFMY